MTGFEIPGRFVSGRFRRLQCLIRGQLLQGLEPRQLALAVALGGTVGSMPLFWGTSLLCICFAALLRLNQALVQLANYLVYPLQILLFLPYFQGARNIFHSDGRAVDLSTLVALAHSNPVGLFGALWQVSLQALLLWLLTAPFFWCGFYWLAKVMIFRSAGQREGRGQLF